MTAAGLLASVLGALLDGGRAGTAALPLALCLYAPVGVSIGLLLGLVGGGLRASSPEGGVRAALRRDPALDQRVAAGILSAGLGLGLVVVLVHAFGMTAASAMANRRLASLATALVAGGSVLVSACAFFPLFHGIRRLTRLLPRHATLGVVVGAAVVLLGAGAMILGTLDWRALHPGPWVMLVLIAVAAVILVGISAGFRRLAGRLSLLIAAVLVGGGLGGLAPVAGHSVAAVNAAQQEGILLPLLISLGRALGDRDGDAYSRWFNGGDCDDRNAAVHPGAVDLPGNAIDENCEGGDAQVVAKAPAPTRPKVELPRFDGNLLLVCIDTLRADKLGVLGHPGGLTPTLDALAGQGVLFTQVYAQGPNTPQSFPSFFTSRYPSRVPFKKTFTGYPELRPEALTFFEVLTQAGIRSAAVSSHFYFTAERGILQGVSDWDNRDATNLKDSNHDIAAPRIVPRAIEKLRALAAEKKRFVLFVHLFEPHSTYVTHPEYPITERGVKGLQQKYDFEVKFADQWLGKLLAAMREAGLESNTAVIAFGDHAEAFGEHRLYFHGQTLYNESLHVPLIVRLPGVKPRVVKERVGLLDLAPTIVELMGLSAPPGFQGTSLLPAVHGHRGPADRRLGAVLMAYPAWPKTQRAMYHGRYKIIHHVTENRYQLFDVEKDPREQQDLSSSDPSLLARLKEELTRFAEQELQ